MAETRDGWGKLEVIFGAVGALGSIAIPVMLFVVGNRVNERQRADAGKQLQADRVERMLGHLASDNANEKKMAVRVLEFFVSENQLPSELLPALVEIASSDSKEDVADTASDVLEQVAKSREPGVAQAAQRGLAALPVRVNVHQSSDDEGKTDNKTDGALADLAHGNVVVSKQTAAPAGPDPSVTELRYFRKEDGEAAKQVAARLGLQGIKAEIRDWSQRAGQRPVRPRSLDLVMAKIPARSWIEPVIPPDAHSHH